MKEADIIAVIEEAGKPLKAGEIADMGNFDKKDVDKAIKKLIAEDKLCSPKRCFYDVRS